MSATGTRTRIPALGRTAVLEALATLPPRVVASGSGTLALPGVTATDVGRALGSYPEAARPVLVALVAEGLARVVRLGPYICYCLPEATP